MYSETFTSDVPYNPTHVGDPDTVQIQADVSTLSASQVDAQGYLIPGAVLVRPAGVGIPPAGTAGEKGFVVLTAVKLAASNAGGALAAAPDRTVVCISNGVVKRAIIEENLGRVLTANELAAIASSGIHFT